MNDVPARLRSLARAALSDQPAGTTPIPDPAEFSDEAGHRRPVDRPFLAWRYRSHPGARPTAIEESPPSPHDPEVTLWSALRDPRIDVDAALAEARNPTHGRTESDAGALFPHRGRTPIEVWTEVELSSLHALWWLARERQRDDWATLVDRTAAWHVQNLQPDNATNHPWALHIFLLMAGRERDPLAPEARLYADTLLHNCMVAHGRPDRFSAHILADAADAIESHQRPEH
ncbi:MAG: hypothetical protein ACTS3F_02825 [Phycisphaerales bacterium]